MYIFSSIFGLVTSFLLKKKNEKRKKKKEKFGLVTKVSMMYLSFPFIFVWKKFLVLSILWMIVREE